jgi:hypothetical protein
MFLGKHIRCTSGTTGWRQKLQKHSDIVTGLSGLRKRWSTRPQVLVSPEQRTGQTQIENRSETLSKEEERKKEAL